MVEPLGQQPSLGPGPMGSCAHVALQPLPISASWVHALLSSHSVGHGSQVSPASLILLPQTGSGGAQSLSVLESAPAGQQPSCSVAFGAFGLFSQTG